MRTTPAEEHDYRVAIRTYRPGQLRALFDEAFVGVGLLSLLSPTRMTQAAASY